MTKQTDLRLPDKLELFHRGSHIEIVRKWFGGKIVVQTVFAIFGSGGFLYMIPKRLPSESLEASIFFWLICAAIVIWLTYYLVAGWLNRTHILVGGGKITVRHRPIPWVGNLELGVSNLKQLYSTEKISRIRSSASSYEVVTYEVHAVTPNGRDIMLVRDLETSAQALYIEQEIEKCLGIEDTPVHGEVGG